MKIHLLLTFLFFCLIGLAQNKDSSIVENNYLQKLISHTQFNTVINPANAGIQDGNISLSSFTNIANPNYIEVHNYIGIDGYVNKKKSLALGIYYTLDNLGGSLLQNSIGFALKKRIKDFHIGLGIEKNTVKLLNNNLVYRDMIDPRKGIIYSTNDRTVGSQVSASFNIKPGIIYVKKKFQIGIGLNHINQGNQSLIKESSQIPQETYVNASYRIILDEKIEYIPMLKVMHSKFKQNIEIDNIFIYKSNRKLHLVNLAYTHNKNVSLKYGISFNDKVKIGIQYNHPIYFPDYFPKSILINAQYLFRKK